MKIKVPKIRWSRLCKKAKHGIPLAGAIVATVGVASTAYFTAVGTKKAIEEVEVKKQQALDNGEEYTKLDAVKDGAKHYIPAAISVIASVSGIWVGYAVSAKAQAALISAYGILQSSYDEYQGKVKELYGEEAHEEIKRAIQNAHIGADYTPTTDGELKSFYEPYYGHWFVCTEAEMVMAEMDINQKYAENGFASMDDLYAFVNKYRKQPKDTIPEADSGIIGWDYERLGCDFDAFWIEFGHERRVINDDMNVTVLWYGIDPEMFEWEKNIRDNRQLLN